MEFTVIFSFVDNVDISFTGSIVLVRGAAVAVAKRNSSWLDLPLVLESLVVTVILGLKVVNLGSRSSSCKWFGMVVASSGSSSAARGNLEP